jgi:release factor glutamine methyltransferase
MNNTPEQYKTGVAYFRYLELQINKNCFIPRPETELIVEKVPSTAKKVLDLCAGTGAIGLSYATEFTPSEVTFVELAPEVFQVLETNINIVTEAFIRDRKMLRTGTSGRKDTCVLSTGEESENFSLNRRIKTTAIKDDCIKFLNSGDSKFDLIMSNPPYIPIVEMSNTPAVDPKLALFSDTLPYEIIENAWNRLENNGTLIVEHFDYDQGKIYDCFTRSGYKNVTKLLDLAGKPRFVRGEKSL